MPLALIQNLQWLPIALRREYKLLSWPSKATPGCSPIPQHPRNCLTPHAFAPALPSGWSALSFLLHLLKSYSLFFFFFLILFLRAQVKYQRGGEGEKYYARAFEEGPGFQSQFHHFLGELLFPSASWFSHQ